MTQHILCSLLSEGTAETSVSRWESVTVMHWHLDSVFCHFEYQSFEKFFKLLLWSDYLPL